MTEGRSIFPIHRNCQAQGYILNVFLKAFIFIGKEIILCIEQNIINVHPFILKHLNVED